jgi:uncharacterized protein
LDDLKEKVMSRKNTPVIELNTTLATLRQIDFKSGQIFHGKGFFSFHDLPRIDAEIKSRYPEYDNNTQGVHWELSAWLDELSQHKQDYRIQLQLSATYPLECQRCLQAFVDQLQFTSQFILLPTQEEVDAFPLDNDEEDALLISHQFDLIELFEDELLLNLPLIPKHPDGLCELDHIYLSDIRIDKNGLEASKDHQKERKTAFEALKKLKFDA